MSEPIIDVGYAKYRGRQSTPETTVFLGIPYAEPPLRELRFRKPVPLNEARLKAESSVFVAAHHPVFALQGATGSQGVGGAGSEDCLKVDIYTPTGVKADAGLPVLVYIHGGAYKNGAPMNWPFHHWIQLHPTIIAVSIYYRLSVLGFLSHPEFKSSGLADLNAGLYDQLEALRWIKRNIRYFGGDPSKVTICGQSAGGSSVELQLTAFEGKGELLFRGAIPQSVYRTPLFRPEQKKTAFEELLHELDCPGTDSLEEQLKWLRGKNAIEVTQAADIIASRDHSSLKNWKPVIDGDIVTDYPTKLIQKKLFYDVPVLVGSTTDETAGRGGTGAFEIFRREWPLIEQIDVADIPNRYPDPELGLDRAVGDAIFRSAIVVIGRAVSKAYIYRWDQPAGADPLVYHCAENWHMYKGSRTGLNGSVVFDKRSPAEEAFSEEAIAYWVSFVRALDPNVHKLSKSPEWPRSDLSTTNGAVRLMLKGGLDHPEAPSNSKVENIRNQEMDNYDHWVSKMDKMQN